MRTLLEMDLDPGTIIFPLTTVGLTEIEGDKIDRIISASTATG